MASSMGWTVKAAFGLCLWAATVSAATTNVREVGLKGDGQTADTAALQKALDGGTTDLYFPAGAYRLGTVLLPTNTSLRFAANAKVSLDTSAVVPLTNGARPFLLLKGDHITVDGLDGSAVLAAMGKDARRRSVPAVMDLIYGEGVNDLTFRNLRAELPAKRRKGQIPTVVRLADCRDVELSGSRMKYILHGIITDQCHNVRVHGNRAFECNTITTFGPGSTGLRHYDNWSRKLTYQCVFRGGWPDPSRKAPSVPLGSSSTVIRDIDPQQRLNREYYVKQLKELGAEGIHLNPDKAASYYKHLSGAFDVQVTNNYAEYGVSLAWGNKGRQVIIEGNIARFMTDYSFGVEGGETVVIANNISINARSVGIMSMYWGSKLLIGGNLVIVREEAYRPEYGAYPDQKGYWGGLMRLHHGPRNKADQDAGSQYGAGQAIVTGNLLVNQLHDQMRSLRVESGRDVMISGNKFLNGAIFKSSPGSVTVIGNEFISDMPQQPRIAKFRAGTQTVMFRNNVLQHSPDGIGAQEGRSVVESDRDEAKEAQKDEKIASPQYAIHAETGRGSLQLFLADGNQILGWDGAIEVNALDRRLAGGPVQLVVRNNNVSGSIRLLARPGTYRGVFMNNVGLANMQAVAPQIAAELPAKK